MKNLLTILLSLVSVAVFAQFDKYFENRTMRVDYYHAGDSKTTTIISMRSLPSHIGAVLWLTLLTILTLASIW